MEHYLEYLPSCVASYSIKVEEQKKAIEKYMNIYPDDENCEEFMAVIVQRTIELLTSLYENGELIPSETEYV